MWNRPEIAIAIQNVNNNGELQGRGRGQQGGNSYFVTDSPDFAPELIADASELEAQIAPVVDPEVQARLDQEYRERSQRAPALPQPEAEPVNPYMRRLNLPRQPEVNALKEEKFQASPYVARKVAARPSQPDTGPRPIESWID
jgi:hypothetical protein